MEKNNILFSNEILSIHEKITDTKNDLYDRIR